MNAKVAERLAAFWLEHKVAYDRAYAKGELDDVVYHATIINALSVVAAKAPIMGKAIDRLTS